MKYLLILLLTGNGLLYAQSNNLSDTLQLQEVTIKSNNAVYRNLDTTIYVADSFNKSPHNMVEDILKKMPGIDVSLNGNISVQGKDVKKIFINGTEAGVNDLRSITQNLPAEIIDKIQVTDLYSDEARALGIKDGNAEKIININIKKEYEHGFYGKAAAGYGTKDLYQSNLFTNYMSPRSRITAIAYANNTGNADISTGAADGGATSSGGNNNTAGVTRQKDININYAFQSPGDKLKFTGSLEVMDRNTATQQYSLLQTYLPGDSILLQSRDNRNNNAGYTDRFAARLQYSVSKRTSFTATANANLNTAKTQQYGLDTTSYHTITDYTFARTNQTDASTRSPAGNYSAMLQRSGNKPGQTLLLKYSGSYGDNNNTSNTLTDNSYRVITGSNGVYQTNLQQQGVTANNNLSLQYAEPLGKYSLLSLEYTAQYNTSNTAKDVFVTDTSGIQHRDTIQSNNYEYKFWQQDIGIKYQYNKKDLTATVGFKAEPFKRDNRYENKTGNSVYSGVNYFPLVNFRYNVGKRTRIEANYTGSLRAPSLNQLQPIPDYHDSLNIYTGNPNLKPELNNSISTTCNYLNPIKTTVFWTTLNFNRTEHKIVNQTFITANKRYTMPVNAEGVYSGSLTTGYTRKIVQAIKVSLGLNTGINNNVTLSNGVSEQVATYYLRPNARLNFSYKSFESDVSYSYNANYTTGEVIAGNVQLKTQIAAANTKIKLPAQITLGLDVSAVINSGYAGEINKNFILVNASVYKGFSKPAGLFIRLQGYDLVNNYPNVQRVVTDNTVEDRSFNRIGRYFLLSAIYKFNKFFKNN